MNQTYLSINGSSLEITLTVPLTNIILLLSGSLRRGEQGDQGASRGMKIVNAYSSLRTLFWIPWRKNAFALYCYKVPFILIMFIALSARINFFFYNGKFYLRSKISDLFTKSIHFKRISQSSNLGFIVVQIMEPDPLYPKSWSLRSIVSQILEPYPCCKWVNFNDLKDVCTVLSKSIVFKW